MNKQQPLYMMLYQQFKTMINENKYHEHQKLPSKRKLAKSLNISPLTVQKAYEQLIAEGYVYALEKSGYYVDQKVLVLNMNEEKTEETIKESIIVKKYKYEFKTNIVDTSLFPSLTWAKLAKEVLANQRHEALNQTDPKGFKQLREEIVRYIDIYRGIKASVDQIIIGSGGSDLMRVLIDMMGRSKHYAIENPNYQKIYYLLKGNECKVSLIPVDDDGLMVNHLEKSTAEIVHVTPSHQFPTGVIMPIQRRNELLNWAYQRDGRFIIEDDYDSEFRYQGKPIPALQSLDHHEKVIYINTFTKTLAPSFRMAYMVLPQKLLSQFQKIELFHGCTVSSLDQFILYRFMNEGYFERHVNKMNTNYKNKLNRMKRIISQYHFAEISGEQVGLHFLLKIKLNIDESVLVNHIKSHHILISGLKEYNQKEQLSPSEFPILVVGYSGLSDQLLDHAMTELLDIIQQMKQ